MGIGGGKIKERKTEKEQLTEKSAMGGGRFLGSGILHHPFGDYRLTKFGVVEVDTHFEGADVHTGSKNV